MCLNGAYVCPHVVGMPENKTSIFPSIEQEQEQFLICIDTNPMYYSRSYFLLAYFCSCIPSFLSRFLRCPTLFCPALFRAAFNLPLLNKHCFKNLIFILCGWTILTLCPASLLFKNMQKLDTYRYPKSFRRN